MTEERKGMWDNPELRDTFTRLLIQVGNEEEVLREMGEIKDGKREPICSWVTYWRARKNFPEWQDDLNDAMDKFFENAATRSIIRLQAHEDSLYDKSWEKQEESFVTTLKATEIAALKGAAMRTRPVKKPRQEDAQGQESEDLTGVSGEALLQAIKLIQDAGKKDD